MRLCAMCMACLVRKEDERIRAYPEGEDKKAEYMREVLRIVERESAHSTALRILFLINQVHRRIFGRLEDMGALKQYYNERLMRLTDELRARLDAAEDPLARALSLAQAGNYIDFGAVAHVEDEKLMELIDLTSAQRPDAETYDRFIRELEGARTLVYVTDNAGEIVLDKLLIERIKTRFPNVDIRALVRGAPILNDATLEDARQIGLDKMVPVEGNGTGYAGTELNYMPQEKRALLEGADMIIAKGQGNFESLVGCGLNVYYMFLCKCDWFVKRFGVKQFTPMFLRERALAASPYIG